jgi:hypothetical protein
VEDDEYGGHQCTAKYCRDGAHRVYDARGGTRYHAELGISRSTFCDWRAWDAPRCIKLPNGEIRIRRTDFDNWLDSLEEVAA